MNVNNSKNLPHKQKMSENETKGRNGYELKQSQHWLCSESKLNSVVCWTSVRVHPGRPSRIVIFAVSSVVSRPRVAEVAIERSPIHERGRQAIAAGRWNAQIRAEYSFVRTLEFVNSVRNFSSVDSSIFLS